MWFVALRCAALCCAPSVLLLQLLAFYSSMHSSLLDSFNSTEADNKMSFIIQDLRLLLQNLVL